MLGHYAGYNMVNRTEVEPQPVDPDFKITGRLWMFTLHPVVSPHEYRGLGILRYRYADPNKGDDQWVWLPGPRRIRRLNESVMSSAMFPVPWNPDHYSGFVAKNEEYDYKFLGEKEMVASVNAEH